MNRGKKRTLLCILASLAAASFFTIAVLYRRETVEAAKMQAHLSQEVFRFHVLANSDSEEDQALKLKVKDAVVTYMKENLPDSDSARETKKWCEGHQKEIRQVSRRVIREEGADYPVSTRVGKCDFPDKSYGDVTFPAGEYEALEVLIGEAKGHNWWCVLYPDLCFIDSVHAVVPKEGKEKLQNVLTEEEYHMVTAMDDFKVNWFFFGGKDK